MANKTNLDLTWIEEEIRTKLEPQILQENREKSYNAAHRVTNHNLFDKRFILLRSGLYRCSSAARHERYFKEGLRSNGCLGGDFRIDRYDHDCVVGKEKRMAGA